jgi:hypothetical protein
MAVATAAAFAFSGHDNSKAEVYSGNNTDILHVSNFYMALLTSLVLSLSPSLAVASFFSR